MTTIPPWSDTESFPDPAHYTSMELFVAGALSTLPPFSAYHPAWALPHAQKAVEAVGDWEPTSDSEAIDIDALDS